MFESEQHGYIVGLFFYINQIRQSILGSSEQNEKSQ